MTAPASPTHARSTLIRGGRVLTMDGRAGELPRGDVLIRDGQIRTVAAGVAAEEAAGAEVVDATGMLVLPGLVDTHRHTWQTVIRHRGAGWSLQDYRRELLLGVGGRFQPRDVYAGTLLGALAALDAGVTTLVDWSHIQNTPEHTDAAVAALRDAGIRAVFAHGHPVGDPAWFGDTTRTHPEDLRRVREELLPDDRGLVTPAMGARGPDFTRMEVVAADLAFARELGIPVTMHVAVGRPGDHQQGIRRLDEAGLLSPDLTLVHVTGAGDEDLERLAEHGVTASVSPQIELTMPGLGARVAVDGLLAAGIRPGLSADSETAAAGDLFTQMRFALAAHRAANAETEGPLLDAGEVLRFATVDGARTAGLSGRVGLLAPGMAADVILVRTGDVNLAPVTDAAAALVLAAHPGNVDTVLVAGQVVKRAGRLLADVERARELATASAARLLPSTRPEG